MIEAAIARWTEHGIGLERIFHDTLTDGASLANAAKYAGLNRLMAYPSTRTLRDAWAR